MPNKKEKKNEPESPHPVIDAEECKACGRCIEACPKHVLRFRKTMNRKGVTPAEYMGEGCTGCAICFYNCPEPYTIEIHAPDKPVVKTPGSKESGSRA